MTQGLLDRLGPRASKEILVYWVWLDCLEILGHQVHPGLKEIQVHQGSPGHLAREVIPERLALVVFKVNQELQARRVHLARKDQLAEEETLEHQVHQAKKVKVAPLAW